MRRTRNGSSPSGRPPKFREPRRPVTVTLPDRTLLLLAAVDQDRARAIVRVTDAVVASTDTASRPLVEVVEILPGVGMILVGASRCLRQIPWLRLVELVPGRLLLSIPSGTPIESLEIAVDDILEAVSAAESRERAILEGLHTLIRRLRRGRSISKAEMLFVDMRKLAVADTGTSSNIALGVTDTHRARRQSPKLRPG